MLESRKTEKLHDVNELGARNIGRLFIDTHESNKIFSAQPKTQTRVCRAYNRPAMFLTFNRAEYQLSSSFGVV